MSAFNQYVAEEMTLQEHLGLWFLPTSDVNVRDSRAGILRFQTEHHAEVDILGAFEEGAWCSLSKEVFRRYPVIHGAAHGQKRFSLFDCVKGRSQVDFFEDSQLTNTQIHFVDGWVGPEVFKDKDAVLFFSYSFGLAGLASWHNVHAFSSEHDFKQHATCLKYKRPEDVSLYEDDQVTIVLSYSWRAAGAELAQTSGTIEHDPRIVIKSKRGKLPFYGGMDRWVGMRSGSGRLSD